MQKWLPELTTANLRVVALTTDSVEQNRRIADRFGISFPILSDADGSVLRALKMWNPDWKIAKYGYFLLDTNLRGLSNRHGNWEPTDAAKRFFLEQLANRVGQRPQPDPGPRPQAG